MKDTLYMPKFSFDIIFGQSYELVERPYTLIPKSQQYANNANITSLILGIAGHKMGQYR